MTTNERLAEAGIYYQYKCAVVVGNRDRMIEYLQQVDFERDAAEAIADTVLRHPTRYGLLNGGRD